jgi:superfamily I DNA/RNA helicase
MRVFERMRALAEWGNTQDRTPRAEIAVINQRSAHNYLRDQSEIGYSYSLQQHILTYPRIGAPYDSLLLDDLERARPYKLYIFENAWNLTAEERAMIDRVVGGTWGDLVAGGDRWRNSAVKWGAELATRPQIRLGTIHAAKGMEADVVVLSTNTTRRIDEAQRADRDQHDEERRIEYVGVTRARRELIVSSEPVDYRMNIKL